MATVRVVLDSLFVFLGSFVVLLCILYYFLPYPYSVVISFFTAIIFCVFAVKKLNEKERKIKIKECDKKLYAHTIIRLNLMKESKLHSLFKTALCKGERVQKRGRGFYGEGTKNVYFISFGFKKVSKADIVSAFNLLRDDEKAIFYSEVYENEIEEFASRFNGRIVLKDGKATFQLLKDKGILPQQDFSSVYVEKKKVNAKAQLLKKKNAKKFFIFGVTFCLLSFLAPFKTYYLIVGGLMTAFSVYLKLFGRAEKTDD